MKVDSAKAYSITKVLDNNILYSKSGSIALCFKLEQPEKYSLSQEQFDSRNAEFFTALRSMPQNTYFHKQDIYLKTKFDPSQVNQKMFLDKALAEHFSGREGISHYCIVAFVLTGLKSLEKAYQANPFTFKEKLESEDRAKIIAFQEATDKAVSIINNLHATSIIPLNENDLKFHIYQYVNSFESYGYFDIDFRDKTIGENYFDVFSISRAEYLPDNIANVKKDEISKEDFIFWEGMMDMIAETLKCNHIYNQIIYFEGSKVIENEIDFRKDQYGKMRSLSEHINKKYLQLEKFLNDVAEPGSETVLVKAHYNVIVFDKDKDVFEYARNRVNSLLQTNDINFYKPSKEVLKDIYLGSIIGREEHLHRDHFFISHLKEALFFLTNTTIPRSDEQGIWFNDRVNQLPLRKDLWDENKKRIYARNGIIVANTGGGKSVTALNFITQFLSQGVNVVVAEFGKSFQFITNLYPELSAHIAYSTNKPLGINPFKIPDGQGLTKEKQALLVDIILKTWRKLEFIQDTHVTVAMNKIVQEYYNTTNKNHNYVDFYNFVVKGGKELLSKLDIEESYFDLRSFQHVGSEFLPGGKYETVFMDDESTSKIIREKQFVVFELTEIKKDPFLVTLILLIIQDTIDTNILADRSKRGLLLFDEFAETQAIKDDLSGSDVLSTVAILYQKIRKENGSVWIIIQDPSQLPDNNYTGGIIANTQILIVLPSNKVTYNKIKTTFDLTDHQMYMMASLKNNFYTQYPYAEQFMKIGEESFVTRLELSKEAFLAFQTDGKIWAKLNEKYLETGDMIKAINHLKTTI